MIISAKKREFFYLIKVDGGRTLSVPDDMENSDRQELQKWLDAGNSLEEDTTSEPILSNVPIYNWQGLAIAFKISHLDREILTPLKDAGVNSQINAIWRICEDIQGVLTVTFFDEATRIGRLNQLIPDLFRKLKEGEVAIPDEVKKEIVDALADNGFKETAKIVEEA